MNLILNTDAFTYVLYIHCLIIIIQSLKFADCSNVMLPKNFVSKFQKAGGLLQAMFFFLTILASYTI